MSQRKKLGIIGTVGVPGKYGGFETLAHHLVLHLSSTYDLVVYCSGKFYPPKERQATWKGAELVYIPFNANGIQSIPYDIRSMLHAVKSCDVLLVMGVSGGIFLPILKLFSNKKIIINIDGIEWKRSKWNRAAKAYLKFAERMAAQFADIIVTDNKCIQEHVEEMYQKPSALIAYGGDHVGTFDITKDDLLHYPFLSEKYAFKVCRIEPENNISTILEAFSKIPDLPLVIVGNWNNSNFGKSMRSRYGHFPHIHLLDPIYEPRKLNILRSQAHLYIHGHQAGGTNPSLVEAMNLSLPILAYDIGFNRETTEHRAKYFKNSEELLHLIQRLEAQEIQNMGEAMFQIARRRYIWEVISSQYKWTVEASLEPQGFIQSNFDAAYYPRITVSPEPQNVY